MTGHPTDNADTLDPSLLRELAAALRGLRYGTVELVVHDARVVQLERRERVRFDRGTQRLTGPPEAPSETGGFR